MSANDDGGAAAFANLVDLASVRVGGEVVAVTDEFFAEASNLLKPGPAVFLPDEYTERGKWMDGWESRRKRVPGHDWCVLKLGLPGVIHGVDVDTSHFLGNHPAFASVDACAVGAGEDPLGDQVEWQEVVPQAGLKRGSQNLFAVKAGERFTHVRLRIYPDGGVARLRVHGEVRPDWDAIPAGTEVDLAAVTHGGEVIGCSDMFFGAKDNMIMPGRSENMGDGWETRRTRGGNVDWAVVRLGRRGRLTRVEVDTNWFKGNHPDEFSLEGLDRPGGDLRFFDGSEPAWTEVLPRTRLGPHERVFFEELGSPGPFTHVRLRIYPDGGVSRLRVHGIPEV